MTRTNWSQQYASHPGVTVEPESLSALQEVVRDDDTYPSPVVVLGSAHSNSGCTVLRGGTEVTLKHFRSFHELSSDCITVGAGLRLLDVHRYLAQRQLQLPFTPEIGNATVGSAACCCLKDAALGPSTGFAASMVRAFKYVDATGELGETNRDDHDWAYLSCGHGLLGIIYEVSLDVIPMQVSRLSYEVLRTDTLEWPQRFETFLRRDEGAFGLYDATSTRLCVEKRLVDPDAGEPSVVDRCFARSLQLIFKYFMPLMGATRFRLWQSCVRYSVRLLYGSLRLLYPRGLRVHRNLKPIDYGPRYRFRWDFHFWAYPRERFVNEILPAFQTFVEEFKSHHPGFDERGLMACYFLREDQSTLLSPGYDGPTITLDPTAPMMRRREQVVWDSFLKAYNDFAITHGGQCTFNQTKHLTSAHVEKAFGERWQTFKEVRRRLDPQNRFLSVYFASLLAEADSDG